MHASRSRRPGSRSTAVQGLLDAAAAADAHAALDEHTWLDLVQGGREGFAGLVAWEAGHVTRSATPRSRRGPDSWALEFVVDPHHRVPGNTIGVDLVRAAADVIAAEGGGHVHMWVNQPRPEHDRSAAAIGLHPGRVLYQMRRPLPVEPALLGGEAPSRPARFGPVSTSRRGWRSTTGPSTGTPSRAAGTSTPSRAREAQPWFDPAGFLAPRAWTAASPGSAGPRSTATTTRRWARSMSSPSTPTSPVRASGAA